MAIHCGMVARYHLRLFASSWMGASCLLATLAAADPVRVGIIGIDTPNAEQFTMRLNDPANPNHVPGGRVVLAFPGGSADIPNSVAQRDASLSVLQKKFGVRMVDDIGALCRDVDAVMLLGIDGRPHLEQAKEVMAAGKPLFIGKPAASSLKEIVELFVLAQKLKVPVMSASSLRWYSGIVELANAKPTPPDGVIAWGPAARLVHHPDLFFDAIHPTEALFTVMGQDCLTVTCTSTPFESVVTGVWKGKRSGTLHALHGLPHGSKAIKLVRFDGDQVSEQKSQGDHTNMLREVIKFFETKTPQITAGQTLEIYGFLEAAERSRQHGGVPISVREVLLEVGAPENWVPGKKPEDAETNSNGQNEGS